MSRTLAPRATSSRRLCRLSIDPPALGPDAEEHQFAGQSTASRQDRSVQGGGATRLTAARERHNPSVVRYWARESGTTIDGRSSARYDPAHHRNVSIELVRFGSLTGPSITFRRMAPLTGASDPNIANFRRHGVAAVFLRRVTEGERTCFADDSFGP